MITGIVQQYSNDMKGPMWRVRLIGLVQLVRFWRKHDATIQIGVEKTPDPGACRVHAEYCGLHPDDVDQIIIDYAAFIRKRRRLLMKSCNRNSVQSAN